MGKKHTGGTAMIRLHITTEGQTELAFVRNILAPYLATLNIVVDARCVLTSRDKKNAKEYRGGLVSYEKARKDIQIWLKEDRQEQCRFSTMFDLYALPKDFPGLKDSQKKNSPYDKVKFLEKSMIQDINDRRFIPYIQLHEFEALILADPQKLDWEYLEHEKSIKNLISMMGDQNPELINENPETAPSKRIRSEIPEYNKVSAGAVIVKKIGLPKLRQKCSHFNEWLTRLEQLAE
jgi:hypothetical protein